MEPEAERTEVDATIGTVAVARLPRRDDVWRVRVDRLASDGEGEVRACVQLPTESEPRWLRGTIRRALPDDVLRVRVGGLHRGVLTMQPLHLVSRTAPTVPAACSHFAADPTVRTACGGCTWQSMPEDAQRRAKSDRVALLLRGAGLDPALVRPALRSPVLWSYRNKMEFSFGRSLAGGLGLGLRPPGYRREVLDQRECRIASPAVAELVPWIRARLAEQGLEPWDERGSGCLRTLMVREGKRTGERMVELVTHQDPPESGGVVDPDVERRVVETLTALPTFAREAGITLDSVWWTRQVAGRGVRTRLESTLVGGNEEIEERLHVDGRSFGFSVHPRSFFQPNTMGAEVLYGVVRSMLRARAAGGTLLDLYCGTGTIGIVVSSLFERVVGVELVEEAVTMARRNAARNGVAHGTWHVGDAGDVLRDQLGQGLRPDAVIVDPPRAGLTGRAPAQVVEAGAPCIVYVSCNPVTLARDLRELMRAGYRVEQVQPVDLFPHTAHVECVALLVRNVEESPSCVGRS